MPSIINASSSGSGGIVQTADASGVLQLQSNGTVALSISGSTVTLAGALGTSGNLTVGGQMTLTSASQDQVTISSGSASAGCSLVLSNGNGTTSNNYSYLRLLNSQTSPQAWNFGTFGSSSLTWYDSTATQTRMVLTTGAALYVGGTTLPNSTGVVYSQSSAKAWVVFNSAGTIQNALNVSSVTRTSTGNFGVAFTTATANAVLCVTANSWQSASTTNVDFNITGAGTTGYTITTFENGVVTNPNLVFSIVMAS
jgi:hypothetical protein